MAQKKYVSLSKLQTFLENLNKKFAALAHTHKISDLTDYTVDSELSSASSNPVQNKVINAEFEAISDAMGALELTIDGKAASSHNHDASNITSGILSVARGGTDAANASDARTNLGFTYGSAEPTGTPDTGEGSVYFRTGGDVVVEVGTSGIWTYRKWASGIAECWGSKTYTATISNTSGSNYYIRLDSAENYPFTFAAVPQQFVTLQSGPYAAWLEINASSDSWPSTTSTGYQMLVSTISRKSGDYTVAYNVIGRWK